MSLRAPESEGRTRQNIASDTRPSVTVIVPCREESGFVRPFLDSLLATTYPKDQLEILIMDGRSEDGTRAILADYAQRHASIRVLDNHARTIPAALNLGLLHARGEIILRTDVHAEYPPDYISKLVEWLQRTGADNVGGVAITRPGRDTATAQAIAHALAHPLGVGNSWFRIGVNSPRWVDTVPFGCYRRDVFERVGGFDEELLRNEDDEHNARLRRAGGRVLLVPDVTFLYRARHSLGQLWRMYFQYGYGKPLALRKAGGPPSVRQLVPALFVAVLMAALAAAAGWGLIWPLAALLAPYLAALLVVAAQSTERVGVAAAVRLPIVFAILHVSYGVGYIGGTVRLLVPDRWRRGRADVPLSR